MDENRHVEDVENMEAMKKVEAIEKVASSSTSPAPLAKATEMLTQNHITVLNILLRDALGMRQRLFSYLQFYLTAQAGLAALFGIVAIDAHEALQSPSARIALWLGILGVFASFLVFAYGLITLRPGSSKRQWISELLEEVGGFGDIPIWADACQRRLKWLLSANMSLDRKVTLIRIGILIQLGCGFAIFMLSLRF